ncbi:2,3-bisphosphoglycerate-independent phosphoglycerate mutase [Candidatus Saccharibacteria bacterium]|nr:2,3-bisphosphoglycerate-independent phosphoglycerate mutase [Candidatus Saccharibacteria bacterium]NIV03261.1 2,3-bisphosphoglycerate-independent phosphoglycerate mutase [Calditrichia bacterium]NIS37780.1 2,3-bisphosphoglycerate-independent phosphoglycerate mutase [Candidatus Saccharibacteria bacterium]NIV71419.1 2,3-bisphosphoglycerate-independent phosphoglycerate mutase [Calditrichia bacterium]NIV97939.1 2,3-bisphosphoglycerate-independent phosphoglycerate mutase [Candidatus Saccharibacter
MVQTRPKPIVLMILDGWGVAPEHPGNAINKANTPVMDNLIKSYPTMNVKASGEAVGLSWGEMGNSEVGHLTIGAGRVFYQSLPRIDRAIGDNTFFGNSALKKAFRHAAKNNSTIHFIGLVSNGGIHSHQNHLHALLDMAKQEKIDNVAIHAFLDGRDADRDSALGFIKDLQKKIKTVKRGQIASLAGRYWAMDRDNRWDRTQKAYEAMVLGQSDEAFDDPIKAIEASYSNEVYDEEFVPTVITKKGEPVSRIQKGDAVIFFNFRPDRARQLTKALVLPNFDKFPRERIEELAMATMTEYEKDLPVEVAYPPEVVETCLGRVISDAGLKQLHIAETEKYAHVTFFLNGTREDPFPGEDRVIVPSPRVASYDLQPEMSAVELTNKVVKAIDSDQYDFIVMNFANADMVGHTGNIEATIKGIEVLDKLIGKIVTAVVGKGGAVFITADHGNAEQMINLQTESMDKQHSTNIVPFIVCAKQFEGIASPAGEVPGGDLSLMPATGMLADVAPTILNIMNLAIPPEMTGHPLIA